MIIITEPCALSYSCQLQLWPVGSAIPLRAWSIRLVYRCSQIIPPLNFVAVIWVDVTEFGVGGPTVEAFHNPGEREHRVTHGRAPNDDRTAHASVIQPLVHVGEGPLCASSPAPGGGRKATRACAPSRRAWRVRACVGNDGVEGVLTQTRVGRGAGGRIPRRHGGDGNPEEGRGRESGRG